MARQSDPIPSERALVPATARGLTRLRRALPVSQRMALGIAASAVGTIFVKRLVELIAEDVYRRARRLPGDLRLRRRSRLPIAPEPENRPSGEPVPALAPGSAIFVRIVRVWRVLPVDRDSDT